MRRCTTMLLLVCLFLSACSQATPAAQVIPPTASVTVAPPTATATATPTLPPTETPLPTATATLTPTPTPQVIGAQNAAQLVRVRQIGNGRLLKLAWSPDGKTLLALTTVKLIALDPATGKPNWEIALGGVQRDAAYHADGKTIVTLAPDGVIQLRDAASGALASSQGEGKANLLYTALSADGRYAVLNNTKRQTSIYESASGKETYTNEGRGMQRRMEGVLLAPDGSWFVTSGYDPYRLDQQIQLWDAKTGAFLRGLQGIGNDFIHDLAVSPDGKYLAGMSRLRIAADPEFSLIVWDSQTGAVARKFTRPMDITAFCFLGSSGNVTLGLFNGQIEEVAIADGSSKGFYHGIGSGIFTMSASPDGAQLASGEVLGLVKIWKVTTRSEVNNFSLEPSSMVNPNLLLGTNYLTYMPLPSGMSVAPDNASVALLAPRREAILLKNLASDEGRRIGRTNGMFLTVALSPDGKKVAAMALEGGLVLYVWDAQTGRQITKTETDHNQLVNKIMFSPDGSLLATLAGSGRGELYLWDTQTGEKKMTGAGYSSMDFTRDSVTLVTDNVDFGLYFWDIAKGRQTASASADWVYDIDFAPDEKTIAVAGYEVHKDIDAHTNLVTFLDTATKTMLPAQLLGSKGSILALRYSPDGTLIATLDDYGCLSLWDVAASKLLAQVPGVTLAPFNMEFLPDGRGIVVGGGDGTLHVFEVH